MTFEVGDRVKLSELGKSRSTKATKEFGVVAGIPRGGWSVRVLFDGNIEPTQLHISYIEPAQATNPLERGEHDQG
jgi:hypothetical protein